MKEWQVASDKWQVKSYKDLLVWQKAMDLAELIYKSTVAFPKEELYGLSSQLRRAAVSVISNLAEGSSKRSTKEFGRFGNMASGSAAEMEAQLLLAARLGYLPTSQKEALLERLSEIGRMLHGLHQSLAQKAAASALFLITCHLPLATNHYV